MLRASLEVSIMRKALSLFAAAVVMLVSAKASASFHLMKVVEVFAGSTAHPNASYVQLEMYSASQNFVDGHVLHVYAADGVEIPTSKVTMTGNVTNANNQANILIGTASVQAAFGVMPDFVLPENLIKTGGAVCYEALDCFSWGAFTPGAAADTSVSPFAALTADKAARRIITGGASATLLEDADDGNNNAMDFAAVDPAPKNNSFGATVIPDAGGVDASTPDGSTGKPDSGIGTMPSPNNPTVQPDSGASAPSSSSSGDSGGCSVVSSSSSSEGWSTVLGLFTAASILVLSRRRRAKR
jgi:hypothetical protein